MRVSRLAHSTRAFFHLDYGSHITHNSDYYHTRIFFFLFARHLRVIMATVQELRSNLNDLANVVRDLVIATKSLAEAPAPPPPKPSEAPAPAPPHASQSEISMLAAAITNANDNSPKEHQGQIVQKADFDMHNPGGITYTLPAEPRNAPEHAQIVKNESVVYKHIDRNRVDPRKASRSHFAKTFDSKVSSPFKRAVLDNASYADYTRNSGDIFYAAMSVWHTWLVEHTISRC